MAFFLSFPILQLIFLLSTSYFSPLPLFSTVFTNLAEIHTRQLIASSPHFGVGTCLRGLLKGVVCLAHKQTGLPNGALGRQGHGANLECLAPAELKLNVGMDMDSLQSCVHVWEAAVL